MKINKTAAPIKSALSLPIKRAGTLLIGLTTLLNTAPAYSGRSLHPTMKLYQHSNKNTEAPPAIARIWHGWTSRKNAARFEQLLKEEVFPGIEKNKPAGYRGVQLLRDIQGDEVRFTTIMLFDSLEAVKQFAGEDFEKAHIDDRVKALFIRYDLKAEHTEVLYADHY